MHTITPRYSKFQRVSRIGFVTAPTSLNGGQLNFARWLAVSWAGTLYVHFRGSCPERNFSRCKIHFASKSCVFVYWQRYCTALEPWASAKLCGVQQRVPPIFTVNRAGITLGNGPLLVHNENRQEIRSSLPCHKHIQIDNDTHKQTKQTEKKTMGYPYVKKQV